MFHPLTPDPSWTPRPRAMEIPPPRAHKPDAQGFDDIRFVVVPRYKTSELSGNEWRISIRMDFYRKGRKIHECVAGPTMRDALAYAAYHYAVACDEGHGYFAGEGEWCDQEGCAQLATQTVQLKQLYCTGGGNCGQEQVAHGLLPIRQFCDQHVTRGDGALEDNDSNYTRLG